MSADLDEAVQLAKHLWDARTLVDTVVALANVLTIARSGGEISADLLDEIIAWDIERKKKRGGPTKGVTEV